MSKFDEKGLLVYGVRVCLYVQFFIMSKRKDHNNVELIAEEEVFLTQASKNHINMFKIDLFNAVNNLYIKLQYKLRSADYLDFLRIWVKQGDERVGRQYKRWLAQDLLKLRVATQLFLDIYVQSCVLLLEKYGITSIYNDYIGKSVETYSNSLERLIYNFNNRILPYRIQRTKYKKIRLEIIFRLAYEQYIYDIIGVSRNFDYELHSEAIYILIHNMYTSLYNKIMKLEKPVWEVFKNYDNPYNVLKKIKKIESYSEFKGNFSTIVKCIREVEHDRGKNK